MKTFFSIWFLGMVLTVLALHLFGHPEEERPEWMDELGIRDERDFF